MRKFVFAIPIIYQQIIDVIEPIILNHLLSLISQVLTHACVSGDRGVEAALMKQYLLWSFARQGSLAPGMVMVGGNGKMG
jgi:hypothetical protein